MNISQKTIKIIWIYFISLFLLINFSIGQNIFDNKSTVNINGYGWDTRFGDPSKGGNGLLMTGRIKAITKIGNDIYFGGNFKEINGLVVNNLAKWNGNSWLDLGYKSNQISSLIVVGNEIYASRQGDFSSYYIAFGRWSGKNWTSFCYPMGQVNAIRYFQDNIIFGGSFNKIDNSEVKNIAKIATGTLSNFGEVVKSSDKRTSNFVGLELGGGVNSSVYSLETDGTNLYVGGAFTIAGTISANKIAKWNGTSWSALGNGFDDDVKSIAISGNNVYAAGCFKFSGSTQVNRIAVWDGLKWSPLGKGFNNDVLSIGVLNNELYAVGLFTTADEKPIKYIAKWDGTEWLDVGGGINGTANILSVIDSNIYTAGKFDSVGSMLAYNIARWDGNKWHPLLNNKFTSLGVVKNIAVSGNYVYVGGAFDIAGNTKVNNIARWDGKEWYELGTGIDPYGEVNTIAVDGNDVYAGGVFDYAGENKAKNIAKWDGEKWSPLSSGIDDGFIKTLVVGGIQLYAGGFFSRIGDKKINSIARWDGENWFPIGEGFDYSVNCILSSKNYLYAGGNFHNSGNKSLNLLAKWDGSTWSNVGDGFSNLDYCELLSIVADKNDIIIGGNFQLNNNTQYMKLAKWNGYSWSAPWKDPYYSVKNIAVKDSNILITVTLMGSMGPIDLLSKSENAGWVNVGASNLSPINSIAFCNNDLYIGGLFNTMGNTESYSIACLRDKTSKVETNKKKSEYNLNQNYPNPFNPSTVISYTIGGCPKSKVYYILNRNKEKIYT